MLPLPLAPLACCQVTPVRVNRYAMVTYDRNRYSVPTPLVGRVLTLKAYVDRIEVADGGAVVARHARSYGRNVEVLAGEHYVDLLAQKPGAVAHARVFRALAEPYASFRAWCLAQTPPATREFVAVLRLGREFPATVVAQALEQSMAAGVYRAAAVRQLCLRARPEDAPPPPLAGPWAVTCAPAPDLTHFDQLLCGRRAAG